MKPAFKCGDWADSWAMIASDSVNARQPNYESSLGCPSFTFIAKAVLLPNKFSSMSKGVLQLFMAESFPPN